MLPRMMISDELASGALVPVLPEWVPKHGIVHAVFLVATRPGGACADRLPRRTLRGVGGTVDPHPRMAWIY
jgi:DNA-binding transcriptional LysR family regulator